MKFNVSIDFETPRWLTKVVAIAVPIITIVGVTTIVAARPWDFGSPTPQALTARRLNELNAVVDVDGGQQYSVGATTYCGTAATSTGITGSMSGYAGARALCQASSGCGTSRTAHMCTSEELVRSAEMNITIPQGWYSSGSQGFNSSGNLQIIDCIGWTGAAATYRGQIWVGSPGSDNCDASHPVLCCD